METITGELVRSLIPKRSDSDNKYSAGVLLSVTGSKYMTGAAVLSARGALMSGVGLLYQCSPENSLSILQAQLLEPVFCENTLENIKSKLEKAKAVLFGCGTELSRSNTEILEYILSNPKVPAVLDASALTMLSKCPDLYKLLSENVILTPHEGEMERLSGKFPFNRENAAREFCEKYKCVLVLKGHNTLVAQGDKIMLCPTGCGAMAKGGYGDLLAGMIAGFSAQGLSCRDASVAGTYLHGLAGEITAEEKGELSALPSFAAENISKAIQRTSKL